MDIDDSHALHQDIVELQEAQSHPRSSIIISISIDIEMLYFCIN